MGSVTSPLALPPVSRRKTIGIGIALSSPFPVQLSAGGFRPFPPLKPYPLHDCPLTVKSYVNQGASGNDLSPHQHQELEGQQRRGFWSKWKVNSVEMSSKLGKLGLAAVLAYGLFDAVTYTSFFVLAFLGYERNTGKNPAANLQALLGIVILMWTGNNITRPFRVGGAAALAPVIDRGLKKIQDYFKFPNLVYAFALVVSIVAASCLTVVALLIISRWGR